MRPYAIFLITLLLLHNVQIFMCRQLASKRRPTDVFASTAEAAAAAAASMKRTISGAGAGQAEELLQQQPGDQIESNYDEYPMVVPKRAALLLDRLMVALHHALEKENSGRQHIVDLYMNNNNKYKDAKELNKQDMQAITDSNRDTEFEQGSSYNMYSDDDPSVLMDYDFKDLNAINRATGESLMAKGFQRRAQGLDVGGGSGGDKIASLGVTRLTAAAAAAAAGDDLGSSVNSVGGAGRNAVGNNGRLYWRCYFNAVSCF